LGGDYTITRQLISSSAASFTMPPGVRSGTAAERISMAMQFRVKVEIEGASPETFEIGFGFSDEEGSGIEFYSNHDLPEDVTEKLGGLAINFINDIGSLVLTRLH
jgi:hypothetical protein